MHPLRFHHVLQAPDDGGTGAAAPAAAPAAAAPAAAPAPAAPAPAPAGAPAAPAPAPASALGGGAPAPGAAPAPSPAPAAADPVWGRIPEKFRVKNDDGTPNLSASWEKVEDHRSNLEKRMGAGEAPPKEAKDYATNVPETLKDAIKLDELNAAPKFQEFRDAMHAAGLSQKQFDQVVGKMLDYSLALQQGSAQLSEQQCVESLRTEWKDDATYKAQVASAYRGAAAFGDIDKLLGKYGNDPDFIRFAAAVGKEVREDTSAGADAGVLPEADIEALQKSEAYWNVNDPKHAQVKAQVEKHYAAKFGTGPKQANSISRTTIG